METRIFHHVEVGGVCKFAMHPYVTNQSIGVATGKGWSSCSVVLCPAIIRLCLDGGFNSIQIALECCSCKHPHLIHPEFAGYMPTLRRSGMPDHARPPNPISLTGIAHGDTRSPAFFFAFVAVFVPVEAVLAVLVACIPKPLWLMQLLIGWLQVSNRFDACQSHMKTM